MGNCPRNVPASRLEHRVSEPVGSVSHLEEGQRPAARKFDGPDECCTGIRDSGSRDDASSRFDEVMSAVGCIRFSMAVRHCQDSRTGVVVVLAKVVSGPAGLLGAMHTSNETIDGMRRQGGFIRGHTYAPKVQSFAAECAVLDELVKCIRISNAERRGGQLRMAHCMLLEEYDVVGDVRGHAHARAVGIVPDQRSKRLFTAEWDARHHGSPRTRDAP